MTDRITRSRYLERGRLVTVLIRWGPGGGPRNVLIERSDGSQVVRPFRGLRKPAEPGPDNDDPGPGIDDEDDEPEPWRCPECRTLLRYCHDAGCSMASPGPVAPSPWGHPEPDQADDPDEPTNRDIEPEPHGWYDVDDSPESRP